MAPAQLRELLLQSLEHERGGVILYQTALECVVNDDLREEWEKSLAVAMKMALAANDPPAAELVACECIVLAETKDHADWELIGECAKSLDGDTAAALKEAYDQVEDEEDEHLYHTKGWCRELWLKSLGLKAVLPPPEEKKDVKTAMDAAKWKQERKKGKA